MLKAPLCKAVSSGELDLDGLSEMCDAEVIKQDILNNSSRCFGYNFSPWVL